MKIAVKDKGVYYLADLTRRQVARYDNGALISCGLTTGRDRITSATVARMVKAGDAKAISFEEWNHSGCQSSCIRRGQSTCSW
jgi:GH24 family phage-related lysozyme (muramidase)